MATKFYIIIPAVAFILILANAFYGHGVFSSTHPEDIHKYSVYVHFPPEWLSHQSNLLFDVTVIWNNVDDSEGIYYEQLSTSPLDAHNYNQVQYIANRSFVELKHGFNDCSSNWQPILYRYVIDSIRNQFEMIQGAYIAGHPYMLVYPDVASSKQHDISSGFVQFIPICSSTPSASYQYSLTTNNDDVSFDVFFVDDVSVYQKFIENPGPIDHYTDDGCFGTSYTSFSGQCNDVSKDSGLLIWVPDDLRGALTKFTVNMRQL